MATKSRGDDRRNVHVTGHDRPVAGPDAEHLDEDEPLLTTEPVPASGSAGRNGTTDAQQVRIDGIEGESTDDRHTAEIDLDFGTGARATDGVLRGEPERLDDLTSESLGRITQGDPDDTEATVPGAGERDTIVDAVPPAAEAEVLDDEGTTDFLIGD